MQAKKKDVLRDTYKNSSLALLAHKAFGTF